MGIGGCLLARQAVPCSGGPGLLAHKGTLPRFIAQLGAPVRAPLPALGGGGPPPWRGHSRLLPAVAPHPPSLPCPFSPARSSAEDHGHCHSHGEGHIWAPRGPGRPVRGLAQPALLQLSSCPAGLRRGSPPTGACSSGTRRRLTARGTDHLRPLPQVLGRADPALAAELQDWRAARAHARAGGARLRRAQGRSCQGVCGSCGMWVGGRAGGWGWGA